MSSNLKFAFSYSDASYKWLTQIKVFYDSQVIDCLQTEETIKTKFCVYFDSGIINLYLN